MSVEVFTQPRVWSRLLARKRTRDRRKVERTISKLLALGWNPPPEGTSEGGCVLGRRLTEWRHDVGTLPELDYRALATLVLNTFLGGLRRPTRGLVVWDDCDWPAGPPESPNDSTFC